jgi:hypothetical protein
VSSLADVVTGRAAGCGCAPRNAAPTVANPHQTWLAAERRALFERWGEWETPGPNGKAVPYVTPFDLSRILGRVEEAAGKVEALGIPDGAKQPGYVRARLEAMHKAIVFQPAPLASKVPGLVQRFPETVTFLAAAQGLVQHFDSLRLQPSSWALFVESVTESVNELPGRLANLGESAAGVAGKLVTPFWPLVAIGAAGLVTVYVLTRQP